MEVDALALMEKVHEERLREASSWRDKRLRLVNDAVESAKKKLESEQEAKYQATKQAVLTRILKEYRSLSNESGELKSYLAARPEKVALFRTAEEAVKTLRMRHQQKHTTSASAAFEEDYAVIVSKLKEEGVQLPSTVVWADGVLFYREMLFTPGQAILVLEKDLPPRPMKIVKILRNELWLADPDSGFETYVSPGDLRTGRFAFAK